MGSEVGTNWFRLVLSQTSWKPTMVELLDKTVYPMNEKHFYFNVSWGIILGLLLLIIVNIHLERLEQSNKVMACYELNDDQQSFQECLTNE